jgi:hypothetical protein
MTQLAGKWNCVTQTPIGAQFSALELKVDGSTVTGTNTNSFGSLELHDGKLEGDRFTYRIELTAPFPMSLKGDVKITGDELEGHVAAGMLGKSAIKGKRVA